MKKLFRYRYISETSYTTLILCGILFTGLWIALAISQYQYYMEKFSLKIWLCERVGLGIFIAVFWLIIILCMMVDKNRKYRKEIMQNGKCCDGEIVGYAVRRNTYYHNGRPSMVHPKTYILCVQCRGKKIITPQLHGNPERILKSAECKVYECNGEIYVTDFDERAFRIGQGISLPKMEMKTTGISFAAQKLN